MATEQFLPSPVQDRLQDQGRGGVNTGNHNSKNRRSSECTTYGEGKAHPGVVLLRVSKQQHTAVKLWSTVICDDCARVGLFEMKIVRYGSQMDELFMDKCAIVRDDI